MNRKKYISRENNENVTTPSRNISYDILRVWAMIMVFVCHLSQRITLPGGDRISYAEGGNGVWIFFVLSGFLGMESYNTCIKKGEASSTLLYYKKRLARIVPLYWVVIIFSIIIHHFYLKDVPYDTFNLGWLRYFLFLNGLLPSEESFWNNLNGYWTMPVFILFYILVPYLYKIIKRSERRARYLFMGAFLLNYIQKIICKHYLEKIVGVSVSEDFRGILILHTLYAFCMGTWIYFIKKKDDSIEYKNIIGYFMSLVIIILGIYMDKGHWIWVGIAALALLAFDDISAFINQNIASTIQIVSKYSFPIYLTHMLCFSVIDKICSSYNLNNWIFNIIWIIGGVTGTVIMSFISQQINDKIQKKIRI